MARSSAFGYTNTTATANTKALVKLQMIEKYSRDQQASHTVKYDNKTCPQDLKEIAWLKSRLIDPPKTDMKDVNIQYPSRVQNWIEYTAKNIAVLSTTDSADPSFRIDEPIVVNITVKHQRSGNITPTHIDACVLRTLSALYKEDGTSRFDDLMRQSETVTED